MTGELIKPIRDSESKNSPARLGSRTKEPGQREGRLLANGTAERVRLMVPSCDLNESSVQVPHLATSLSFLAVESQ